MPTSSFFESEKVKYDYALILTNWMIETYNIDDDTIKRNIFNELHALSDHDLMERGKMINDFLDIENTDLQQLLGSIQSISHSLKESEEKMDVIRNTAFNF